MRIRSAGFRLSIILQQRTRTENRLSARVSTRSLDPCHPCHACPIHALSFLSERVAGRLRRCQATCGGLGLDANDGFDVPHLRPGLGRARTTVLDLAVLALVYEGVRARVAAAAVPHDDVGVGLDHLPRVGAGSRGGHGGEGWNRVVLVLVLVCVLGQCRVGNRPYMYLEHLTKGCAQSRGCEEVL